uniref:T9SS type A sorting domain-containing protein n=1 Tax=Lewinella cohaerens TaxID=70995 RepID=UPI0005C543FE
CDACPTSSTGDSDGDGVCDDADICPGFDDLVDTDEDTVPNGCDLCPGGDDLLDNDHDNIPDECDDTINGGEGTGVEVTGNNVEEVYPNPTTGELRLILAKPYEGAVQIFDVFGNCVLTYSATDEKYLRLNVELLPSGTYIVLLNTRGAYGGFKRFVKVNR